MIEEINIENITEDNIVESLQLIAKTLNEVMVILRSK